MSLKEIRQDRQNDKLYAVYQNNEVIELRGDEHLIDLAISSQWFQNATKLNSLQAQSIIKNQSFPMIWSPTGNYAGYLPNSKGEMFIIVNHNNAPKSQSPLIVFFMGDTYIDVFSYRHISGNQYEITGQLQPGTINQASEFGQDPRLIKVILDGNFARQVLGRTLTGSPVQGYIITAEILL